MTEDIFNDPKKRLETFYKIVNKDGVATKFSLNWTQGKLYDEMWFCNIVLKARQLGISTFVCLLFLDRCFFNSNVSAGIVCHTREDAEHMFKRIKYAYENLPTDLRDKRPAKISSARELTFSNNSTIFVATSLRSRTVQYLHISEFGKICAHDPHKAKEIITGSLETVGLGGCIFIESTAEGRGGAFYDMCKTAEALKDAKINLTQQDYKFHFFPWWECPDYAINQEGIVFTREIEEYFKSLDDRHIPLTTAQKNWYFKKSLIQKEDMKREYPSFPDESFAAANEASWFGKWLQAARQEGRVGFVPWEPDSKVHTAWDIGFADSTSICFYQLIGQEVHFIDYYENSGEALSFYVEFIKKKPYLYGSHFAPHDIAVKEFSTGTSRYKTASGLGINFIIIPSKPGDFSDGIEITRNLFPKCFFDEKNCSQLLKCIENYRKKWDEHNQCYKNEAVHDKWSHGCFPKDTLISTPNGAKPIQEIQVGDEVLTPEGDRVVEELFSYDANEFLLISGIGFKLICTKNHKIFSSRGLVSAEELEYNDVLFSSTDRVICKTLFGSNLGIKDIGFRENFLLARTKILSYLMEKGLVGMDSTLREESDLQGMYGDTKTEKSLLNTTSIIWTKTQETIPSRTLNAYLNLSIYPKKQKQTSGSEAKKTKPCLERMEKRQRIGTRAKKEESGIQLMERLHGEIKKTSQKLALAADVNISLHSHMHQNTVPTNARPRSGIGLKSTTIQEVVSTAPKNFDVTSMQKLSRVQRIVPLNLQTSQKVYDFRVHRDHCYYANGILVSNSDSLRYSCVSIKNDLCGSADTMNDEKADQLYNKYFPRFD